jgi:hypothetical protein
MKGYPPWFRPALVLSSLGLLISGCLLAPTTLQMRTYISIGWRLGSGARLGMATLHAALAFAAMLFLGALWSMHMRSGWRRHRKKTSGLLIAIPALLLAVTGMGVYYLSTEELANASALIHLSLGLAAVLPFVWHLAMNRRHK